MELQLLYVLADWFRHLKVTFVSLERKRASTELKK